MLALIARMKIREGKEADFERVMGHLASQVRSNEPGNQLYVLCKGKEAGEYTVLERYDNQDALTAHSQSAHYKEAGPALAGLLDGRPRIEILKEVG
jgi:quinol monooxygenase YgiN